MTNKSIQKFKYLENEKSSSFIIFKRLSIVKNCLRHESAPLKILYQNSKFRQFGAKKYQIHLKMYTLVNMKVLNTNLTSSVISAYHWVRNVCFFVKFGVLCFLETPVLRFTLLTYYQQF